MRISDFLFKNIALRQTIAKNTFWIFVSQIGGRLIRAGIVIYAARIIGPTEYGVFSYAISLAAIFSIFTDLGLDTAILRQSSMYPERRDYYFSSGFIFKLFIMLASVVGFFILGP